MPASPASSVLNRTPSSTSRSKDIALGSRGGVAKSRRKQVAPPVTLSADDAQHRLNTMTRAEHERVTAFLQHGSFKAAALALDCHETTVAATWKQYSGYIGVVIAAMKNTQPH